MTTPLICVKCGAPLPIALAGAAFVACAYCNATLRLEGAVTTVAKDAPSPSSPEAERRHRFLAAFKQKAKDGMKPFEALTTAAREHLAEMGQSDALARATLALAIEFDEQNGTTASTDAEALSRIADAYMKACAEMAVMGRSDLNLPFLSTNAGGEPRHLNREVTPSDFAQMASRVPVPVVKPPEPPEPPEKKGWWPF